MIDVSKVVKGFQTAESRWARFGPYYAMFPVEFAFDVIQKYSNKGDHIIDPFAGRGTSIYAGSILGRKGLGIEINPLGWLYGAVKLRPAIKNDVEKRLSFVYSKRNYFKSQLDSMPKFYRMCYCDEVLKFLLSARKHLDWRACPVDATLVSIIAVYMHGKLGEGLSNQMKMTKSMGIDYSIRWWKANGLSKPPEINPFDFLLKKLTWRYEKGIPPKFNSRIILGDSTIELNKLKQKTSPTSKKFSLLFTSPPYCSVTDYHADQWLRLWLLGGPAVHQYMQDKHKRRFSAKDEYYQLLDSTFGMSSSLMAKNSVVYVRTDKRDFTFNTTLDVLKKHFPKHSARIIQKPFRNRTQTEVHGNISSSTGEVDIIMTRQKT